MNLAYEIMCEQCIDGNINKVKAMKTIANCSGVYGMVNGQAIDLKLPQCDNVTESQLVRLIEQKTMALIRASIISGAILAQCSEDEMKLLEEYAYNLGLAFQIRDDFEDEEEDLEDANDCPNFLNILGREKAKQKLDFHADRAYKIISAFDEGSFLCDFHKKLFN